MKKYDAIIIGSGQAGTPLAFKLAANNQKVAFIEKEHWGGTCLNVGCTPTKTYVASARRMYDIGSSEGLGVEFIGEFRANLSKIKARKDALIQKSINGIEKGADSNSKIDTYFGSARFVDKKTVEVNNSRIQADKIYINVGARALVPDIFNKVNYMTNKEILELEELPEHLIIIGGSYIGLEFGQMFRRFGSKVTIIEQFERIIGREDTEVSDTLKSVLEQEGVNFELGAKVIDAEMTSNDLINISVETQNGIKNIIGSHLLVAIGRKPNNDTLNLENAGVETDERGFIKVNDYLETNVEGIFALGDCNGKGAFTHTAYNDYEIIAENMFEGKDRKVSDRIMTYGLFTDPPLGRAGITLEQAKKSGKRIKYGYRKMKHIARAREKGETNGFMNVIIDAETDLILGAAVLGVNGDEIISSILNIMYAKQPYTVIRDSIQPHPTVSELIPTMLETLEEM